MPPMFAHISSTEHRRTWPNPCRLQAGHPARRHHIGHAKIMTTGQFNAAAIRLTSPICRWIDEVTLDSGWCQTVWPCDPTSTTSSALSPFASSTCLAIGEHLAYHHIHTADAGHGVLGILVQVEQFRRTAADTEWYRTPTPRCWPVGVSIDVADGDIDSIQRCRRSFHGEWFWHSLLLYEAIT